MGRTGRHGSGEVVYLIYDEGKDLQKYDRSLDVSSQPLGLVSIIVLITDAGNHSQQLAPGSKVAKRVLVAVRNRSASLQF